MVYKYQCFVLEEKLNCSYHVAHAPLQTKQAHRDHFHLSKGNPTLFKLSKLVHLHFSDELLLQDPSLLTNFKSKVLTAKLLSV